MVPHDVGDIVAKGSQGAATEGHHLGQYIVMGDLASKFQMGVVDSSIGVSKGNQLGLNLWGETGTPNSGWNIRVSGGWKPSPTHARVGSIMRPRSNGVIGSDFCQFGGTITERVGQVFEI